MHSRPITTKDGEGSDPPARGRRRRAPRPSSTSATLIDPPPVAVLRRRKQRLDKRHCASCTSPPPPELPKNHRRRGARRRGAKTTDAAAVEDVRDAVRPPRGSPSTPVNASKWQDRVQGRGGRRRPGRQASDCATHGKADDLKLHSSPFRWVKPLSPDSQVGLGWTGAALAGGGDEVGKSGMRIKLCLRGSTRSENVSS